MLLNTVFNSATAQQFRDTIFKILRVQQYCISSILSQSVGFIECYLVPDHQEVVNKLCKFRQPLDRRVIVWKSQHIMLLASGQIIFKILHVRQSRIFLISSKY